MNTLASRTLGDYTAVRPLPLAWHLLMQLLVLVLFAPLIGWLANQIVFSTGDQVISNFDIANFVLSWRGLAFVLLVAALALGLLLAELAGHSWLSSHAIAGQPVTLPSTVAFVVSRLPKLIELSTRIFLRILLMALPFLGIAALVWFTILSDHDINFYLSENPPIWRYAKIGAGVLAAVFAGLAVAQLARWLFSIPVMLFEETSPAVALQRSAEISRGRILQILRPLLVWFLILAAGAALISGIFDALSESLLAWAGVDVHRVLPSVALLLALSSIGAYLYTGLQASGHQFLITRMYTEQTGQAWALPKALLTSEHEARRIARPAVLLSLGLLALVVGVSLFLVSRLDLKQDVAITAHRGASLSAPENTMAAFRAALAAGADYVELDVQRTQDGSIAVLHDADLMRMGGDPRKIRNLTVAQLATIDIGRKRSAQFAGEHVPLLADVIAFARGKMKINIELKYNGPDPGLAAAVVDLLRRENFLDQVVITSLDYAALKEVKRIEPRLQTGHIVTAAVGDVTRTAADFVSLNSAQATPSMIERAHKAGKKVHVWTVNKPEVMLRMIERDVDNIITDDPALLNSVMKERNTLSAPEMLGLHLRVLFSEPPKELIAASAVPQL
jgi:glycerophosphoryl diester phosphodiesterase